VQGLVNERPPAQIEVGKDDLADADAAAIAGSTSEEQAALQKHFPVPARRPAKDMITLRRTSPPCMASEAGVRFRRFYVVGCGNWWLHFQ